jgi:hypothetical protein
MSEHDPRVLSLDRFQFNFTVDRTARLRALMGAPAFALRRKRLDRAREAFWRDLERRYEQLWIAAGEGRIGEDGREIRQVLLDDEGRDPIGGLEHRRRLYRDRVDRFERQRIDFRRAWSRHVGRCGLEGIRLQVEEYNRYFPIEANLSSDPGTGKYLWMGTFWEPLQPPGRADVFDRLPLERPEPPSNKPS